MKAIAKNRTRKIEEILSGAARVRVFSLSNQFSGRDCPAYVAKEALFAYSFAKLLEEAPGRYRVRVHGECWYEIETANLVVGTETRGA